MSTTEIIVTAGSAFSMIVSLIVLYFTLQWKTMCDKSYSAINSISQQTSKRVDDLKTSVLNNKDELFDLKEDFLECGLDYLKVCAEDHEKSIDSIRKDLLDLQVLSGTLPSRAGTMRDEVAHMTEALKAVQSNYLETRAVVDRMKEQMESLAEVYSSLHFTGKEIEEMRDELEDLSRRTA